MAADPNRTNVGQGTIGAPRVRQPFVRLFCGRCPDHPVMGEALFVPRVPGTVGGLADAGIDVGAMPPWEGTWVVFGAKRVSRLQEKRYRFKERADAAETHAVRVWEAKVGSVGLQARWGTLIENRLDAAIVGLVEGWPVQCRSCGLRRNPRRLRRPAVELWLDGRTAARVHQTSLGIQ